MKAYVGQTNLTLALNTGITLTSVTTALIKFIDPSGNEGSWTGTVSGLNVEHAFQPGELNSPGTWTVWVHITFSNNKVSIGEPASLIIYSEGK